MSKHPASSIVVRAGALLAVALLAVAACGSSGTGTSGNTNNNLFSGYGLEITPKPPASDPHNPNAGAGTPKRGGKVVYGLTSEDTNGYCLPEAQLDASGEQVAGSVYDTLVRPNAKGVYVPYLAKSVTHSPDYLTWTITLRSGIKFSDGSALTAEVLKNNLNAYRGKYPGVSALLFQFVFDNISSVTVSGPLTVSIAMHKPWKDFEAFLFADRRLGIVGQAQLDDKANCAKHLVGTGPFKLVSWEVNERYVLKPNPYYWRKAPDGKPYPYLSELDYIPLSNSTTMLNAFESGRINAMYTATPTSIVKLRELAKKGKAQLVTSVRFTGLGYMMLNAGKPPFNDYKMRLAAAEAIDFAKINRNVALNVTPLAAQPFPPGSPGYNPNLHHVAFNPAHAKKLVAAYTKAHGKPELVVTSTPDPQVLKGAKIMQQYLNDVGFDAKLASTETAALISNAIAGKFQIQTWSNHPGSDPGTNYVWWHTGYPTNFGHIDDPIIDCLLEVGRSGSAAAGCLSDPKLNSAYNTDLPKGYKPLNKIDPNSEADVYQAVGLEFHKKLWNIWGAYNAASVAVKPDVHGLFGAKNPDGSDPYDGLNQGMASEALWVE